jgi:hypothetical protein
MTASDLREVAMPSARLITTPVAMDHELIEGRYAELDAYTVGFERFPKDVDPAPYFVGRPDDRCTCPHRGMVTSGQLTFRWPDHEETYVEGDAYFAAPGHLPLITAGTSVVEFSPTADLAAVQQVIARPARRGRPDARPPPVPPGPHRNDLPVRPRSGRRDPVDPAQVKRAIRNV